MLKSIGVIFIYIAIGFFQIHQLKKEKMIREIWIFSILMVLTTGVTVAKLNNLPLPSPLDLVVFVLKPFIK
ncbi:hypothetical protein M670_03037 [Schinkia azotoformans MEV2011]|uniref:Uncharacterized protein n=1 Tax=Schinkia azotoformans MEV2011 TaxID=1348973 RepID=A0A072NJ62_SCHAZ|nr:hypothetical protein [Schinkia azotoformans]KEF37734.1 hypothetical protein M670_03037 [Schinkia azotoformans MEV2011]MEC1695646.1 hypothetical protein [Schinkia azotoformans]MEC1726535.1 hypothetical protein [Schinkia azotoformans]MEC1782181.1 hypothetical protein [Schinkia azotoformans]MED4331909.1 hypothetical protein [Schinkia azotoformans]